jgi:hypothetical protein
MFRHLWRIPIDRTLIRQARKRILSSPPSVLLFAIRQGCLNCDEYGTIILPVVVHGTENWSLTLREEHGQWVYERAFSAGGRGGEGGVVCGHSGWLGPTGGNMCGKTNVLNEQIFFSRSINFKLLSQGNSVNNCDSTLKLIFSVWDCHCDYSLLEIKKLSHATARNGCWEHLDVRGTTVDLTYIPIEGIAAYWCGFSNQTPYSIWG